MSVEVMAQVFKRYPVGGGEMMLALALADHAHDNGSNVFPSVAQLAKKTRQSERTVQYQLRKLEDMGWLILVSRGGRGARDTREWCINSDWLSGASIDGFDNRKEVSPDENKGAKIAPLNHVKNDSLRVQSEALRVQPEVNKGATAIAPEPSYNHQLNITACATPDSSKPVSKRDEVIRWDQSEKMFYGISEEQMQTWERAFPGFDVDAELTRIELWYDENPKKRKRAIKRFITAWLARAFERSKTVKVFVKRPQLAQGGA